MPVILAVVIILLVIGSLIFHFASPWYFTPIASAWGDIDNTVNITFIVTGIVFVLVNLFTAYCILKFRHKPGHKAHYEPESHKLEMILTVITAIGVALMLAPGLIAWGSFVKVPDDALRIEALGKQWNWSYRLPGDDGEFGNTDVRQMSPDNPMGIDVNDPSGADDLIVSQPIVHLAQGQATHLLLRSTDVLHNFTVPQFRVKMDLVPGMVTYQWMTPTEPGSYEVLCEELCGIGHFAMRSKVVVESPEEFDAWVDAQPTFAETQDRPAGNATAGATTYAICATCHGPAGLGTAPADPSTELTGNNGPRLAGQGDWYLRRQIANFKNGLRGTQDAVSQIMVGMVAALQTEQDVENVIAYIETFPDAKPPATVVGDVERGRKLYQTCGLCHGADGQGNWNANAPRLAGMSDWYIARQLRLFKEEDREARRGGHPDDVYGNQMNMLAGMLKDEDAINDVIAYINTLP